MRPPATVGELKKFLAGVDDSTPIDWPIPDPETVSFFHSKSRQPFTNLAIGFRVTEKGRILEESTFINPETIKEHGMPKGGLVVSFE